MRYIIVTVTNNNNKKKAGRKMYNPAQEIFNAIGTKSTHKGYTVCVRDRSGEEREIGTYSKSIAYLRASEFSGFPLVAIRNEETQEFIILN